MLNEERRQKLQELVSLNKRLMVKEVAREFNISEVTIRKDLKILEERGILTRVHGGAIIKDSLVTDKALIEKEHIHSKEKFRIASQALKMINPGDVVILDSGSTTTAIARQLKFMNGIKVITNAINIATELAGSEIEVTITGGFLREKSFSMVGPLAEMSLEKLSADKLFLGVDGIHFEYGLTTPNLMEGRVNQLMIKIAHEVILVADASKFGRRSMSVIASVDKIDRIITDRNIRKEDLDKIKDLGIIAHIV